MFQGSNHILEILLVILAEAAVSSEVLSGESGKLKSTPREPCKFHESNEYYYLSLDGRRKFDSKEEAEGSGQQAVSVRCFASAKRSKASELALCFDGEWYPSDHRCVEKTCDPVHNTFSTIFSCTTPEGKNVSCELPASINTKITIQCSHWRYTNPEGNERDKLCLDGKWEKLVTCKARCGMVAKPPNSILASEIEQQSLFMHPWHVVIYHLEDNKWTQRCVGTILEENIIITAGSCFHPNFKTVEPKSFQVSVGEYHRDSITARSLSRSYNVLKVFFSEDKAIALIITEAHIEYTDTVGNVCIRQSMNWNMEKYGAYKVTILHDDKTPPEPTEFLKYKLNAECKSLKELEGQQIRAGQFCAITKNGRKFNLADKGAGFIAGFPLVPTEETTILMSWVVSI